MLPAYAAWGIEDILVVNPIRRIAWAWSNDGLTSASDVHLLRSCEKAFDFTALFRELEKADQLPKPQ